MPGSMAMPMAMPLLPAWLVGLWIAALAVVVVLHLYHAVSMHGQPRIWHISHILMAAGMITMYALPQPGHADLYWGGVGFYGALTAVMAVTGARWWRRDRLLNWLWAATTVDMAAMTYMALPAADRPATISYLAIAYLAVEVVIWLSDPVPRLRALLRTRTPQPRPDPAPPPTGGGTATRARPAYRATTAAERESVRLAADVTVAVRATLAVMSASMIWMLLAMQTMQPVMSTMTSMH